MLIIITALPKEVEGPHAELEAALARRRDLQRRGVESAAAEPPAASALEAARAALEDAELDFALATDEDEKALRQVRDRRRREFQEAEEFLQRVQQLRRGIAQRAERTDTEILTDKGPFDAACAPFCNEVLAEYRELLRRAVFGGDGAIPLARALRLGYALLDALPMTGTLRSVLDEVNISDIGPAPGRPFPHFIKGAAAWPDDDDRAGVSLRRWQDDAEIVALHALLKPFGATYTMATAQVRQIEAKRAREAQAAPASAKASHLPRPKTVSAEEFMASQPTAEEHRAIMQKENLERIEKNRVYPPLGETTFHGNPRFAGQRI
jgi:hypothetical protein